MNIDPTRVHRLKNKLSIILGFCELLLSELPEDSAHRADVTQIYDAAKSALVELPPLPAHEVTDALDPAEARDGR
jgi:hypothetical protein